MKYRKNIYCEKAFIKSCIDRLESLNNCSLKELLLFSGILRIVSDSITKLFLDLSPDEIDNFSKEVDSRKVKAAKKGEKTELSSFEKFMYNLFVKQQNQEIQLKHFNKINFDNPNEVDLNAYYFTCNDSEQCKRAMNNYGVLAINADNLKDFDFVLKDNGRAICKSDSNTWKTLLASIDKPPYNSLIIIDNYILNNTDEMVENLECIFDSLLPSNICVPFQITIFSKIKNDKGSDLPCKPRFEKIEKLLKKYNSNKIELSIIKCQSFHDRVILTNSLFIGCPGGFNLFKQGKSQKTTYYNTSYPILGDVNVKWVSEAYSNYIADAASIFLEAKEYGNNGIGDSFPQFYIGNKENRIIDGYKG